MLSLQLPSRLNNPPVSRPPISIPDKPNTLVSESLRHYADAFKKRRARPSSCIVHAVEKDSHQFEVDPDKAREALQELDQQLQSLSQKQVSSPKIRAPDVDLMKDQLTEKEFSDSFVAYSATALVLFTIFYNLLFETVIKPAIDVPLLVSATKTVTEASKEKTSD
ncbi:hypothetical protein CJ030_MR1G027427 [Morella rubra]|uniref:Uncharacterized protein n=1 Tax=Morella rubra TaxID=262757 RepID=A0A6A1WV95_9ROSI|nr:hypothetical protein CJ030_MR1G027427 [Morella rubra]